MKAETKTFIVVILGSIGVFICLGSGILIQDSYPVLSILLIITSLVFWGIIKMCFGSYLFANREGPMMIYSWIIDNGHYEEFEKFLETKQKEQEELKHE